MQVCANCHLTKCWRCDTIKIRRVRGPQDRARAAEKKELRPALLAGRTEDDSVFSSVEGEVDLPFRVRDFYPFGALGQGARKQVD